MKYYPRDEAKLQVEREKDRNAEEGNDTNVFYNLKNGRTVLRVLPPFGGDGVWFRELHEYYFRLGEQHLFLTSPADFGLPDPLFEYNKSVYEEGNEAAIKEAKRFRPKSRYLMNVVVLSDGNGKTTMNDGIRVLKAPTTVKRMLVDYDTDVDYGDITNVHKGFNMIVDRTGEGLKTEYKVKAQRERTNLEEILQQGGVDPTGLTLHDLDVVHRKGLKSEIELKGLLEQLKSSVFRAIEEAKEPEMAFGVPESVGGPHMTGGETGAMPNLSDLAPPPSSFSTGGGNS